MEFIASDESGDESVGAWRRNEDRLGCLERAAEGRELVESVYRTMGRPIVMQIPLA